MNNYSKPMLVELKERLDITEEECLIINEIVEESSLFGKKNKNKIINEFINHLSVSEDRAEEIYNTFMSIIKSRIKYKLRHPFKKINNSSEV